MQISVQQTQSTMAVLDDWELDTQEISTLLGLQKTSPRQLERFRQGTAFPDSSDLHNRITHIAGIAQALYTSFPKNSKMAKLWLRTPHRRFHNQTPLTFILKQPQNGLIMVRCELDCAFSWEYSQTISK